MLSYLGIHDIGLVSEARLEFGGGLNVLSGESGAGKSVALDALGFVLGQQRARTKVRRGATNGHVEALFDLSPEDRQELEPSFERLGLPLSNELVLSRRLDAQGRSRCFVQGTLVPLRTLGEVAARLVEFSDQGDSHDLRSPQQQLHLLDACAGLEARSSQFEKDWNALLGLGHELERMRAEAAEAERRRDFLEFQLTELNGAGSENFSQAEQRLLHLLGAAERVRVCRQLELLVGGADDNLYDRLDEFRKRLAHVPSLAEGPLHDKLLDALEVLDGLAREAHGMTRNDELVEGEIDELRSLVERVRDLARKHRVSPAELEGRALALREELACAERAEDQLVALERSYESEKARLLVAAESLHQVRERCASELSARARAELGSLGLGGARLELLLERAELGSHGVSSLTIGFASHPAAPALPLGRVASGGELGRVLLALRLAATGRRPLLVLDEIDAGSGGQTAERIGESLSKASRFGQIWCVTHWPQVACRAERHVRVEKISETNGARSQLVELEDDGRVDELCRMLGGTTDTARGHACALLAAGRAEGVTAEMQPASQLSASQKQALPQPPIPRSKSKRPSRSTKLRVVSSAA